MRYAVKGGESRRADTIFPEGIATRSLRAKEVFWSDDLKQVPDADPEILARYNARQLLTVPLLGADGRVLGMFGVLDRLDDTGISREDIRRARALAAQVAVVLEVAHNLHQSELNRHRSDVLIQLAREIDGLLRLPDFARKFVERAVELCGAHAGERLARVVDLDEQVAAEQRALDGLLDAGVTDPFAQLGREAAIAGRAEMIFGAAQAVRMDDDAEPLRAVE